MNSLIEMKCTFYLFIVTVTDTTDYRKQNLAFKEINIRGLLTCKWLNTKKNLKILRMSIGMLSLNK